MSDIVNQIDLTAAEVNPEENGGYSIHFNWTVNGSYTSSYSGDYVLTLYENSVSKDSKTFQAASSLLDMTVTFQGLEQGKTYHICLGVPESAGGVKSGKVKLIINSFTEVSGILNGDVFQIYWKSDTKNVPVTRLQFVYSNGMNNTYYSNTAAGYFRLRSEDFRTGDTVEVSLAMTDKNGVRGPVSPALHFSTEPLVVLSAGLSGGDNASRLQVSLKSTEASLAKVKLYFKPHGKPENGSLLELPDVPVAKQPDGTFLLGTQIPGTVISYDALCACSLCAAAVQDRAESCVQNEGSRISLEAPALRVEELTGEKIRVAVENADRLAPAIGYELPDGSLFSGKEYAADFDRAFSMFVYPRYDREGCVRRGPASNTVTSFLPGYYIRSDKEGREYLQFYQDSFSEETQCHVFEKELFETHLETAVAQGTVLLEPLEQGYRLTVNGEAPFVREDYTRLVDLVKDKITPYGFYSLCDVLLRLLPQLEEDTLYYQCAFLPNQGTADLRPGLSLHLSTALYQPQFDPKIADASGFSAMYGDSWPVTMREDGVYLEFDRYAGAIAEHMNVSSLSKTATQVVFASGLLDLLQPAVRQPFYRILYPEKLTHDYATETPYPSDHTVILAADSYGAVLDASSAVCENRAAINNLPIPLVIFKGRSTLSIHMPVSCNGQSLSVPVGTTAGDVLQRQGIFECRDFALYRRGHNGREYPVFISGKENPGNMVLISGDRIVCRH